MDGKGYLIWRPANPSKPAPEQYCVSYVWDDAAPMRSFVRLVSAAVLRDDQLKEKKP